MKTVKLVQLLFGVLALTAGCTTTHRVENEAVRLESLRQVNPGLYEVERNLAKSDRLASEAESDARRR
jgi:hypothetical protein